MTVHKRVEQVYEEERHKIYSYLLYLGLSAPRAQEATQDAFLKLYLKMSQGETIENPRAWVYRVAHNLALRSFEREPELDTLEPDDSGPDPAPSPEHILIEEQRRVALERAIRGLSPQQRNVLQLRMQGLRYREIAEVIGISTSAVGEFLRRAAVRIKEAIHG